MAFWAPPCCASLHVSQLSFELCTALLHSKDFYPAEHQTLQALPITTPPTASSPTCACLQRLGRHPRWLSRGLSGDLPAWWRCQPLWQLHLTPTDVLFASSWPPWRVFCLYLQSTDAQKANPTNQAFESKLGLLRDDRFLGIKFQRGRRGNKGVWLFGFHTEAQKNPEWIKKKKSWNIHRSLIY